MKNAKKNKISKFLVPAEMLSAALYNYQLGNEVGQTIFAIQSIGMKLLQKKFGKKCKGEKREKQKQK